MRDTLPPHSMADERGVISCVLQDSELCLADCSLVTLECFYDALHIEVWKSVLALQAINHQVNPVTVNQWLRKHAKIESLTESLNTIVESSPSAYNLAYYLTALFDFALRRQLIRGCIELTAQAMNGHTTAHIMQNAERLLSVRPANTIAIHDGNSASLKLIDDLERRHNLQGQLSGLDTGIHALNRKLDGLQYGEQTLIAARPSIGKTALGLGIFTHVVFVLGLPALFVSLEMSTAALMRRMLASQTGISMGDIRRGSYTAGDFQKITTFRGQSAKKPIHILDGASGMGIGEICASVRRHIRKHGTKLVVVDYLQKIKSVERHEKRTYEVADVSGRLRGLAVDTGVAFLTLAQLNREPEKDKPRSPRLSDLADSGQIERDADTVILIDRRRDEMTGEAALIIAKQRDGETGLVKTHFNGPLCRFENVTQFPETRSVHND